MTTGEIILAVLIFLLGFFCLIKGGDWFVDGAVGIAKRLHIPEIIIGATIVSIGTTLPEVMVSTGAAMKGNGATAYGNAIGSIICNTALIAALTVAIRPSKVDRKKFILPVLFFFGAAVFYALNAYLFGGFSRTSGVILLLIFVAYMLVTIFREKKAMKENPLGAVSDMTEDKSSKNTSDEKKSRFAAFKEKPIGEIVFFIIGAALIAVGAYCLIEEGPKLARLIGVPESVIALVFVALGTSLPELITAIQSLIKGHGALSLGNIVGANLFNLVLVSGLSTTVNPYNLPVEKTLFGKNAALVLDTPLFFVVMALLTIPTLISGKLKRYQGIVLLTLYTAYIVFQFFF